MGVVVEDDAGKVGKSQVSKCRGIEKLLDSGYNPDLPSHSFAAQKLKTDTDEK